MQRASDLRPIRVKEAGKCKTYLQSRGVAYDRL